jgi:hypothetical protein
MRYTTSRPLDIDLVQVLQMFGYATTRTVLLHILLGQSVLFVSQSRSLLAYAAEAMVSFIRPFEWMGVYIPVLPRSLLDYVQAPVPFIMGCTTLDYTAIEHNVSPSTLVVFLDTGEPLLHSLSHTAYLTLPISHTAYLTHCLSHTLHISHTASA